MRPPLSSFETASAIHHLDATTCEATIPDGWQQGRGAFGGLVLGTLARAIESAEPAPERLLRALNGEICGPVQPGTARIALRVLRRGNGLSTIDATLDQGGDVLARATAILAKERPVITPALPPLRASHTPWDEAPVLPIAPPLGPVFAQHYQYRSAGPYPHAGGTEALAIGWIRTRDPLARLDAAAVIAYLDAYWPSVFAIEPTRRAMATVSFTAEILTDLTTLAADAPLLHVGRTIAGHHGYVVELRELHAGDRLVALNQQVMAILT